MVERPLISVITPVFNGAASIQRTIDSIRQQDYPEIEHIVMDACSTDGTVNILRANAAHLTWFSEKDRGQSDAINRGFEKASGTYLTWLNADDFLMPGAFSRCMDIFSQRPELGLVYGKLNLVRADGTLIREWRGGYLNAFEGTYEDLFHWDNFIPQPGTLFSREAWNASGPLPIELYWSMDYYLFVKIAQRFPVAFIPYTTASLTVDPDTKSSSGGLERLFEYLRMLEALGSRAPLIYFKIGNWYYQHNEMRQARHYFAKAMWRRLPANRVPDVSFLIVKTYLGPSIVQRGREFRRSLHR